jgi:hypothetical protein
LIIGIRLSGFLFLFIIITNILSNFFGYKTIGDEDPEVKLQKINKEPKKFKIGIVIILIEHFSIISLALTLILTFGSCNIILGIIWCVSRIGEGLIQIYDKKNYWGLLNTALKYSDTNDTEKDSLVSLSRNILKTKSYRFSFAQILFSVGTFAYSILFALYEIIPIFIGWFGIVASILYGLGNVIFHIKPNFKVLWSIGGGLVLLFELLLGGWLLFFPF